MTRKQTTLVRNARTFNGLAVRHAQAGLREAAAGYFSAARECVAKARALR